MKILMVSADYLPNIGGIAAHIFHLSHSLQRLGHEVTVLNPVASKQDKVEISQERGIRTYRIFYPKHQNPKRIWMRTPATKQGINKVLADWGAFDILHQHDHMASTIAMNLSKSHAKRVWTNHTSDFLRHFENFIKRNLVRLAYLRFKGILAVSQELYEKSKQLWGARMPITYIPNGVDTQLFTPDVEGNRAEYGIGLEDFVVLCPRRMVEKNGVLYLAQAVNILLQRQPDINWRFVFLGSEPTVNTDQAYINHIKKLLAPNHQSGHVIYLGNVPMKQMPLLNALADVVVMPSLMEAVSLSALEAMASRKPLTATRVGGLPEIVHHEETGLLIPARDPQALAQAILRLYREPMLREHLAKGGYCLATERYSWDRIAEQTVQFYQKVLSN